MRPPSKARGGCNLAGFNRRATRLGGMQLPSNPVVILARPLSIEKVGDELQAGGDELSDWARVRGTKMFLPPDPEVVPAMGAVSTWVTSQGYESAAVHTFMQVADYYLVAQALAHQHAVVTHEIAAASTKRIKIPNVCIGLGIKCLTPFEMLRKERARFVMKDGK